MDLFDAIDGRSSARALGEPGPSDQQIARILDAGRRAPDHGRLAPWRFVVLQGHDRMVLGDAMAALRRRNQPDASPDALAAERNKAFRAPAIIAVGAHVVAGHKVPEVEQIMAVAACVQNMCLAAHALGLCANWKTGAAAYDPALRAALGLAECDLVAALLYIGTRAAE
jgi:nitroreductase